MRRTAAGTASGLAIGLALAAATAPAAEAARMTPQLEHLVRALGGDPAQAGARRYDDLRKVSGSLAELAARRVNGEAVAGPAATAQIRVTGSGRVLADVAVQGPVGRAARQLGELGMSITGTSAAGPQPMVEGWLPLEAAGRAAGLDAVAAVVPVQGGGVDTGAADPGAGFGPGPGTDAGSVLSQGDVAHNLPAARALPSGGVTGASVKVGVISDSISQVSPFLAGSQALGDLPAGVTVLSDDPSGKDEGRAMAEIVYDEAPGITQMYFASGSASGALGKRDAINALAAAGAKVIADDVFWLSEPFFQDGIISQAVDRAKAAGVAYFASAGNRARQSWEGTYLDAGGFADFGGGDTIQTLGTVNIGGSIQVALQWDEPWGRASSDLDAQLVTPAGAALPCASGTNPSGGQESNVTTGRPAEVVIWKNSCAGPTAVALRVQRFTPGAAPFMKWILNASTTSITIEHPTNSDAINPDAASAGGAVAVAAVSQADPGHDTPESFSSRGPKTRLFDMGGVRLAAPELRAKPTLAAADVVSTSLSGFNPFPGTSAAAPSAAGIATLLRSLKPALPVDLVYALMTEPGSAIPCEPAAGSTPASDCGVGFILADRVMARTLDATPPSVKPVLSPAAPAGRSGWYRGNVGVGWSLADAGSPVLATSGCAPVTVASDGRPQLPCAAVSAGGPASAVVTVKRDATPPGAPRLRGLASRTYARSAVPAPREVRCRSFDATSGLASCFVIAVPAAIGRHTARAIATDVAGNTATATVAYRVVRDPGRARLRSAAARGGRVIAKFAVPGRGRLDAVLTGRASGRRVTLARGRAASRRSGTVTVRLRLTAAGRRALHRRGAVVRGTLAATFRDPATLGSSRSAVTRTFVAR